MTASMGDQLPARRPTLYFIGDSLTQDGANPDTGGWITRLQHKHVRSVDTVVRGLSGYNTKWFIEHALPVVTHELKTHFAPSLVTLWLGANDAALLSGWEAYQHVPLDAYRSNLELIVHTLAPLLPAHAKLLLITPGAVIDSTRRAASASGDELDRSDAAAAAYARACVDVATVEHVAVLDLHTFMHAAYPVESDRAALFSDGLHFTMQGNTVVAQQVAEKIAEILDTEERARLDTWQLPDFHDLIGS